MHKLITLPRADTPLSVRPDFEYFLFLSFYYSILSKYNKSILFISFLNFNINWLIFWNLRFWYFFNQKTFFQRWKKLFFYRVRCINLLSKTRIVNTNIRNLKSNMNKSAILKNIFNFIQMFLFYFLFLYFLKTF